MCYLGIYHAITVVAGKLFSTVLFKRLKEGKEDRLRYREKKGITNKPRPEGDLIWIHAASVGEAQSATILINRLSEHYDGKINILITTGTLTSANFIAPRLPKNAIHQFFPLDRPRWIKSFLDHWKPDIALWIESELWPNILMEVKRRNITAFLINGRMSEKSYNNWKYVKSAIKTLLDIFLLIMVQTEEHKKYYKALGAKNIIVTDNLKYSAAPLRYEEDDYNELHSLTGKRKMWLYAATHDGEEQIAFDVHKKLKASFPDLLTIIVPRHPERSADITAQAKASGGLNFAIRSKKEPLSSNTDIYLADTIGELGLFYKLCRLACIGRSLSNDGGGGHNPIEAAQLNCAVIHGENVHNFAQVYADMDDAQAAIKVSSSEELEKEVRRLLGNEQALIKLTSTAENFALRKSRIIDIILSRIIPVIDIKLGKYPCRTNPTSGTQKIKTKN